VRSFHIGQCSKQWYLHAVSCRIAKRSWGHVLLLGQSHYVSNCLIITS
jgi:hypothetical protein